MVKCSKPFLLARLKQWACIVAVFVTLQHENTNASFLHQPPQLLCHKNESWRHCWYLAMTSVVKRDLDPLWHFSFYSHNIFDVPGCVFLPPCTPSFDPRSFSVAFVPSSFPLHVSSGGKTNPSLEWPQIFHFTPHSFDPSTSCSLCPQWPGMICNERCKKAQASGSRAQRKRVNAGAMF